jgi:DNA primase
VGLSYVLDGGERGTRTDAWAIGHSYHNADGELVAYCGRSVDQTQPRHRAPSPFAKSEILFNMHRAASEGDHSVIVVEGFFDCMKVHQAGIGPVVGLMGSALYEPQRQLLLGRFRRVVLFLGADATGRRASTVIAQKLRPNCEVRVVLLADGLQPDQLPKTEIAKVLQTVASDD